MSSPRHRLDVLLKKAKRLRRLDSSVARNTIATIRELIEAQNAQSKFPVTTLYCNWSLHTQISGSLTALRCLADITRNLRGLSSSGANVDDFLQFLSEQVFQVRSLRRELLEISDRYDLTNYVFAPDYNWAVFVALVLDSLIGKPLRFPVDADLPPDASDSELQRKAKRIYQELFNSTNGVRRQIFRSAWISLDNDPWDERPEPHRTPVFHCNMQTFDGVTNVIRITNTAPLPEADEYALTP